MAADDMAAGAQPADAAAVEKAAAPEVAGSHEKVSAPAEVFELVGDRLGARSAIVEREQQRHRAGRRLAADRIDRDRRPRDAAGDGAQVFLELPAAQLVAQRIAARKAARILAAGRRDVVVHQGDRVHQQMPRYSAWSSAPAIGRRTRSMMI